MKCSFNDSCDSYMKEADICKEEEEALHYCSIKKMIEVQLDKTN